MVLIHIKAEPVSVLEAHGHSAGKAPALDAGDRAMCGSAGECGCEDCGVAREAPEAMRRMVAALGVARLLQPDAEAEAAERCGGCEATQACEDFLAEAELNGADHAPTFCRNAETFDALASEVPAGI